MALLPFVVVSMAIVDCGRSVTGGSICSKYSISQVSIALTFLSLQAVLSVKTLLIAAVFSADNSVVNLVSNAFI